MRGENLSLRQHAYLTAEASAKHTVWDLSVILSYVFSLWQDMTLEEQSSLPEEPR